MLIVETFPWAVISPSVHRILAHGAERVELNEGFGLGDMSEEGLEALNKLIRRFDASGSRSDSTVHRFTDIYNHLWDRSRPLIVEMERTVIRKKAKIVVGTEIETLSGGEPTTEVRVCGWPQGGAGSDCQGHTGAVDAQSSCPA